MARDRERRSLSCWRAEASVLYADPVPHFGACTHDKRNKALVVLSTIATSRRVHGSAGLFYDILRTELDHTDVRQRQTRWEARMAPMTAGVPADPDNA
eukprot:12663091-Prorocentrum_lima.AAC.1